MIKNVKELARVRPANGVGDQVLQGVAHGPRFRVAGVEEHQYQVGKVDDVIGDPQGRGALGIGVKAGGVDEDLAAQGLARASLELEVGVDALTLAGRRHINVLGDLIEREAGVRVQGYAR